MPTTRLRAERLQIMLSPEELTALDDFRFKRRMPSRAAAVRELLKRGLAALLHEARSCVEQVLARATALVGATGCIGHH